MALFQHNRGTETEPSISVPLIFNGRKAIYCRDVSDPGEKHIVLVNSVKAMESPERVIPSLVWVDVPDRIYNFLPHALYFCSKSGLEFRGRNRLIEDWELSLWARLLAVDDDKGAGEMIESRAEVVNSIPHDAKQRWRDRVSLQDVDDWLKGIAIDIYPQGVRTRAIKNPHSGLEVLDMFFGPLDFLSNS